MSTQYTKDGIEKNEKGYPVRPARDVNYYDSFANGEVLHGKKKNHLPAMGWNSWNAFGSGNTEALTRIMADAMVSLGLDRLGYRYVVLDDGCYKSERVNGLLSNEEGKFPNGFRALADYIHAKGLKFGMYNDIGTNLCAGAEVGTCGHEEADAANYIEWGVDFIKVDNCYYLWDNATFSNAENARYVYAPAIRSARIVGDGLDVTIAAADFELTSEVVKLITGETDGQPAPADFLPYVREIGTLDGTGPAASPTGALSGEAVVNVAVPGDGKYKLYIEYATGREPGIGEWLQVAIGEGEQSHMYYDDFVPETPDSETFVFAEEIEIELVSGENKIRLMNHRRQENTLASYAALLESFGLADPDHDVILSICEWGKTQPHNWGYKVGDSWRILNDITFRVGSDGDPGVGAWDSDYTTSVLAQYRKAVIMDEFAGLDKGWNDPDMLMVGMNGMTEKMNRTHMTMWCMMNSPLMLGLDLRRVEKGDALYTIISNADVIAFNQDPLGVQAKRVFSSALGSGLTGGYQPEASTEYVLSADCMDILAKPLADGSVAVSFFNLNGDETVATAGGVSQFTITAQDIVAAIGSKMVNAETFAQAGSYRVLNVWTKEEQSVDNGAFICENLVGTDNLTLRITPEA